MAEVAVRFEWMRTRTVGTSSSTASASMSRRKRSAIRALSFREDRVVDGEQRLHAIDCVDRVLLVAHTVREYGLAAIICIVSARKATPKGYMKKRSEKACK